MHPFGTLTGRHALVCGASQGIGRATAEALAALGCELSLLARNAEKLEEVAASLRPTTRVHVLVADLDDREALGAQLDAHLAAHGPMQILINNTGGPPGGRLLDASDDALLSAFQRHVLAAHLLVRKLLPGMTEAGWGRVVSVLSTSVREPIEGLGVSNIQRAAVASWTKTLSRELPPGVTINAVLPGFTDTDRLSALAAGRAAQTGTSPDAVKAAYIAQTPVGRLGLPEELGAAVAWLCTPSAAFVHGVCLPVDGGRLRSI